MGYTPDHRAALSRRLMTSSTRPTTATPTRRCTPSSPTWTPSTQQGAEPHSPASLRPQSSREASSNSKSSTRWLPSQQHTRRASSSTYSSQTNLKPHPPNLYTFKDLDKARLSNKKNAVFLSIYLPLSICTA